VRRHKSAPEGRSLAERRQNTAVAKRSRAEEGHEVRAGPADRRAR
jgi:hypothetical protein